jgi:GAF domain-containing protein/sugar diacid utilization regulator
MTPVTVPKSDAPPAGRATLGYPAVVSAFSEVAHAINDKTELDSLLHLVAERICTLLGIRRCSVYLKDPATGVFRGQVAHSDSDIDVAIKRLTAGIEADGFTREILRTKEPVLIVNAQSDPRPVRSAMLEWDVRTMLGVPMVLRGEVIGLLFLDNEEKPHDYSPEEQRLSQTFANLAAIAISQAQLTADLRSTLSTAAQQNAMLRRAAALEDRLTNLVLEGASLGEIAAAVTELTGKPCSIHGSDYRRLAHATPAGDSVVPRVLDPAALRDPAVRDALAGLTARRPTVIPPIPSAGLHQRCLVAAVRVGEECWGYLVLMEYRTRFGAQDAIVARRTATVIALELSGKQRAAEAESHAVEALARDLLHGSDDPVSLARRADYHGLALCEPHYVALLSLREQAPRGRLTSSRVAAVFARVAPELRAFVAGVEKGAAIVLEQPETASQADAIKHVKGLVERVVRELAPDGSVTAAISTVCRGAAEYPGAHEQTRQVSRGISTFGAQGQIHVLAADDLGAGRLLLATADRAEADRFVRDTLGPLLDVRDAGTHDLFVTLQAFFECSRSVRRSAAMLEVHENTIRYRLARIEEITGLDILADGDVQLAVQLALLILRLEDRLGGPEAQQLVTSTNGTA